MKTYKLIEKLTETNSKQIVEKRLAYLESCRFSHEQAIERIDREIERLKEKEVS